MLGPPKPRRLADPIAVSLEELVPPDNFHRQLEAKLDLRFVRDWVRELYAERGRPSLDPVVFFKFQLVMFFGGIRSERQLVETASVHLAHRAEVHVYALGGGSAPVSAAGPEDGAAFRDVPAGWSGEAPVILRTDRDRAAYAELYVAGGEPFWHRDGVGLLGLVPVQVGDGFLVPTTEGWLLVDQGGGEQNLGPVAGGEVTAAVAGPNGLLAYLAGGSVWVGDASNPAGAAPIAAGSGFDFAPDGSAIAVTDGASLTVYDLGGGVIDAWTPGDGSAVGAPYWNADGIVVPVGSALRLVPSAEIGA